MVELVFGLHHRSAGVVIQRVGLHHGCFDSEQEISWGGEANDGASPQES